VCLPIDREGDGKGQHDEQRYERRHSPPLVEIPFYATLYHEILEGCAYLENACNLGVFTVAREPLTGPSIFERA
jgi:hypothetical protein